MNTQLNDLVRRAEETFAAADFQASYALALNGLRDRPEHPRLLSLAGRAAVELGLDDAISYLTRLVDQTPDDAAAWRDLAMARLGSADTGGAEQALRTAIRLDSSEPAARVNLGHVIYMGGGAVDEADSLLWEAAMLAPGDVEPLRSLVDMRRLAGRTQAALEAAAELTRRAPDDVLARLDLAELHLLMGSGAESLAVYRRLRDLDIEPGHAVYIIHAMIEVEIHRERWRRALDLTITATSLDRHQLTTDLLTFVSARLFGEADRPTPARLDVEQQLNARRAEHRRLHAEALVP